MHGSNRLLRAITAMSVPVPITLSIIAFNHNTLKKRRIPDSCAGH
jgi:hypothetical protein